MSYILEALKKSDRERKQGQVPDLQSIHGRQPVVGRKKKKVALRLWGVATLVLIMISLALYWGVQKRNTALQEKLAALEKSVGQLREQPVAAVQERSGPKLVAREAAAPVPAPVGSVPPQPRPKAEVSNSVVRDTHPSRPVVREPAPVTEATVIRPENLPPKVQADTTQERVVADKPKGASTAGDAPLLEELPEATQKQLPPLKFAGHAYAKEAEKRMIMINNRICREGDLVEEHLVLEQILWEGVLLRYQDIRFRVKVP